MIIDEFIDIKINVNNFRHFKGLKYSFNRVGEIIKIKDLKSGLGITNINSDKLYKNWDGIDYYDNEYIEKDRKYPTIDHKISVFYGFVNNIAVNYLSSIDNLCVTKRGINCSKNKKTEAEFKLNR